MSKIFLFFLLFAVIECFHFYYIVADEETQQEIRISISSKTKFIRNIFTTVQDYILNTWFLIIEDDLIEIKRDQRKWKTDLNRFRLFVQISTIRSFKMITGILREVLYPIRILYNVILSITKTTVRFIYMLYVFLCNISTMLLLKFLKTTARVVRLMYRIVIGFTILLENIYLMFVNTASSA